MQDFREQDEKVFLEAAKPDLDELETVRKEKLKIYQFRRKIGLPIATLLAIPAAYIDYLLLFVYSSSDDDSGSAFSLMILGAAWYWITQPKRQYAKAYKEKILPRLAKLFGNLKYVIDGKIEMEAMKRSKIVPGHHRYTSEDYFKGTYKGVDIEFSEIDLEVKRRSKNRTYYVSVFKGLAVMLEMQKKKFYGHTIMDKDKGKISEWFKQRSTDLKRANLVDPEFEKTFDVYTNDQVEARYLIDPIMIESLKELDDEFKRYKPNRFDANASQLNFYASALRLTRFKKIKKHLSKTKSTLRCAFYENKMLILLSSNYNHFEPADLHIPATDKESLLQMRNEIAKILFIIDKLDLYDPADVHANAA